ncbi:MAG: hydroxyacid dehydrogenase, partial [Planctomycetota bacterium]
HLAEIDGWIVRSGTQVTAEALAQCSKLKAICRAGAGTDNVDLVASASKGVVVMNTPGTNARAAAELTIALMFAAARNIPFAHHRMAEGGWDRSSFVGNELFQKTVGVVGVGRVGRIVAQVAGAIGMRVIGYDPGLNDAQAAEIGVELGSLDDMFKQSDFLALHTPLTPETKGLIGRDSLAQCKKGVRIINCSRGGVVDEEALLEALEGDQIACVALDVFSEEPLPADSPLRNHPKIITTPHLGASTREAQIAVGTQAARQMRDVLIDGNAANTVSA